jgi:2-polyprenyl-3-methyl-5-hydroxy-6-metoxy-1,4-benzoquinol methylase
MGGLFISVYAKKHAKKVVQGMQLVDVACGVGNVLTNKGAVAVVMRVGGKTIALVNSHLAAHQKYVRILC